MAGELAADTVGQSLRDEATRGQSLDALEALPPPVPRELALAAAPALVDTAVGTVNRIEYNRVALLLARLLDEAAPDTHELYRASFAGERFAAYLAPRLIVEATQQALATTEHGGQPLTREHARSYACMWAFTGPSWVRGWSGVEAAVGRNVLEAMAIIGRVDLIFCQIKTPSNDMPRQMLVMLAELLRSEEASELLINGAWMALFWAILGRPHLAALTMELGLIDLVAKHLYDRPAADMISISRGKAGLAFAPICAVSAGILALFSGQKERPDLDACVTSNLFDICLALVVAFEVAGTDGLQDTNHAVLNLALWLIHTFTDRPDCQRKLRAAAKALTFCLDHSLAHMEEQGHTSGAHASMIVAGVFGSDEGGGEFEFTQKHVDLAIEGWSQILQGVGWKASIVPTADTIFVAQMSISDANKPLLLANEYFISYLVDALLLDPHHPRAEMAEEFKSWCQLHHCEALAQLAVHADSREALLRNGSVKPALEVVQKEGLAEEVREKAAAALVALSDKSLSMVVDGQKHVMLSYQWDVQATIARVNASLIARGYVTWFDLTNMKGSTMDAMSDAIEGADAMLYAVSLRYKESANCRLEAQYAHQQGVDMIPLMMQKDYSPKGWLGLVLGSRLWYAMWDAEKDSDAAFDRRLSAVVREIGDRGKPMVAEAVPPLPSRELAPMPAPASTRTPTTAQAPGLAANCSASTHASTPNTRSPISTSRQLVSVPTAYHDSSPSMKPRDGTPVLEPTQEMVGSSSSFEAMATCLLELRAEAKAEKAQLEAKVKSLEAKLQPSEAINAQQLNALQTRLEAAHSSKGISDSELYAIEDLIADYSELAATHVVTQAVVDANETAKKMQRLVAMSETLLGENAFCRQLRRKFC